MNCLKNEDGFVLILAMLALALLSFFGTFALNSTTFELRIAGNDRSHKDAFYSADSGIYTAAKVVSKSVNKQTVPTLSGFTLDANLYTELAGFTAHDAAKDIQFSLGNTNTVEMDVERKESFLIAGGGAEFASGAEGVGVRAIGIYFDIDSFGNAPNSSKANVAAQYLLQLH